MTKTHRKGAVGALMDEYERAAAEFSELLNRVSDDEFEVIRDRRTLDEACRSIQTVVNHVVSAGYGYAGLIRKSIGAESPRPEVPLASRRECLVQLADMLAYTVATLDGRWELTDDEIMAVQIQARWGPTYDLEQLLEHAVVHVMRHRRQIERFLTEPQFRPSAV